MSAKINYVETLKNEEVKGIVEGTGSTSSKIRSLAALGVSRSEIALMLNKRYQHVRNVLVTQLTGKKEEA